MLDCLVFKVSACLPDTCTRYSVDMLPSGKIGCSYYDPVKCLVYVLEDTQENPQFDLTRTS